MKNNTYKNLKKGYLVALVISAFIQTSYSQDSIFFDWQKTLQTKYELKPLQNEVKIHDFLAVSETGFLSSSHLENNDGGAYILYTDCKGDTIWTKKYGFPGKEDFIYSIAKSGLNNFLLAGYTSNSKTGGYGLDVTDATLYKIDNIGNVIYYKTFGGSALDIFQSVIEFKGAIYACGYSLSNDGDLEKNKGYDDMWLIKINGNGDKVWSKSIGGTMSDEAYSLAIASDQTIIIAGRTMSSDGDILNYNGGTEDAIVSKIDTSGNIIWTKAYGGKGYDCFNKIKTTSDNNLIAVGFSVKSETDQYNLDFYIVKMNNNGDTLWTRKFGGELNDVLVDVLEQEDGYIIIGNSESSKIMHLSNKGEYDFYVMKYDFNGNLKWIENYSSVNHDMVSGIVSLGNKDYLVNGSTIIESFQYGDKNRTQNWQLRLSHAPVYVPILTSKNIDPYNILTAWNILKEPQDFNIKITEKEGKEEVINSIKNDSYAFSELKPSTYYNIRASFFGKCNFEYNSNDTNILTLPIAPINIKTTIDNSNYLRIHWSKCKNNVFFEIQVSKDSLFTENLTLYNPFITTDTIAQINDIHYNDLYFRIRSKNLSGYSSYSSIYSTKNIHLGLFPDQILKGIIICPNPVINNLSIQLSDFSSLLMVEVYDVFGKLIINKKVEDGVINPTYVLNLESIKTGTYLLVIQTNKNRIISRFIKN